MAWVLVIIAGTLEAGFAIFLKLSHGFRRFEPTVLFAVLRWAVSACSAWRSGAWRSAPPMRCGLAWAVPAR